MTALKLTQIGNSVGVILPKELLARLKLEKGDTLLIAGKGHETGQIIGDRVIPFSDQETAIAALQGGAHV